MQREIKFRGKRVDNGNWVHGYYYELSGIAYIIEKGTGYFDISCGESIFATAYCHKVIPETVGQYTGLNDKNGKEIYEGDIYHLGDRKILYIVVWHDTGLIGKQARASSYAGLEHWQDRIHVIGNIHDNPELLQEVD